ncbi:outer membrane beta-barrel protein [Aquibium sp. LZ166]|mgnify:CR=1 FL=1|uniref:Outer membrane beta-barrel protein n=1 Tax=Aquibium pacificus TaxID=3153579 RepID=A0ABV3SCM4_9HYPH
MLALPERRSAGSHRLLARQLALLASTAVLSLTLSNATAQENQLRGQLTESQVNDELLGGQKSDASGEPSRGGEPTPGYVPVSEGALDPDEETRDDNASLFPMEETDAFTEAPPPTPGRAARATNMRDEPEEAADAAGPEQPDLEETDDTAVGTVRQERVDALDEEANRRLDRENPRTAAIETPSFEEEENPYSPLGLRVGTFDVFTTLDQGFIWSTNSRNAPDGSEGVLSQTELRLNAVSDWTRHSAAFNAFVTYKDAVSGDDDYDELQGGVDASFRADLAHEMNAAGAFAYTVRPESASSPVDIGNVVSEPLLQEISGNLSIGKDVGKARYSLTGALDREIYSDADLSSGGTLSQKDRNFTLATVALRAGYEVSPAIVPFVEAEIGRRYYDLEVDSSGYARSADRLALRGGVELDFGEKLSGEVSAGWLRESFDDERLTPISGLLLDAALVWSPTRGTTVSLIGSTEVEGTTTASESGSVRYAASVEMLREVRANLTLGANAGFAWRDYVNSSDHELTLSAETNATWWFNRYAGINGRLRHERFDSTIAGRDYDASSIYLGLKLQR